MDPPSAGGYRVQPDGPRPPYEALLEGQVLFEQGAGAAAAALFDSVARAAADPNSRGRTARRIAWALTHVATARAAAGDTASLARLADSIEALGPVSGYGRDRRLHHHVRGLLLMARGRPAEAAAELHEALGRAFEAVRQPDSALAHYRRVLAAWRNTDGLLAARRDSVAARAAALSRIAPVRR